MLVFFCYNINDVKKEREKINRYILYYIVFF